MKADYYSIACNDLQYFINIGMQDLREQEHPYPYNNVAIQVQQIVEKLLKYVCEFLGVDEESYSRIHSLGRLYKYIRDKGFTVSVDWGKLLYLSGLYYVARYPGDEYVEVSREEALDCVSVLESLLLWLIEFRKGYGLSTDILETYPFSRDNLLSIAKDIK